MTADEGYLLDNQQGESMERFDALSELFNPTTFRHLDKVGVAPGWRVWEVGAGAPSVPTWLAGRVGTRGYVLATDIDISWLDSDDGSDYEVLRHDVGTEPAPPGLFGLIHARLVLGHGPDPDRAP